MFDAHTKTPPPLSQRQGCLAESCLFLFRLREVLLNGGLCRFVAAVGHDNTAVGLSAGGEGRYVRMILQRGMDHMALISVHRFERDVAAVARDLARNLLRKALQCLLALEAVAFGIDIDAHACSGRG